MKTIIFGFPGTGKTYSLMQKLEKLFNNGINPLDICFCTFTKSASNEAKERAVNKFGLKKEDLTYFGTIHSLCFRRFCMNKEVVTIKHLSQFFKIKNLEYQPINTDEELLSGETFGDEVGNKLMHFYDLIRITECKKISEINESELKLLFHKHKISEENFIPIFSNVFNPHKVLCDYEKFKEENNLVDFVDMLLMAYKSKWVIPTKILIVDEAQDLSPIQWAIYDNWKQNKEQVFLAGDDDQSIYGFHGSDPSRLLREGKESDNREILKTTWRLRRNIHNYCLDYVNNNIKKENRIVKEVIASKEGGEVIEEDIGGNLERVLEFIRKDKITYILFRTNSYKRQFISEVLLPCGIDYWEIRGQSLWSLKSISLFNAIVKLKNGEPLNVIETAYLIDSVSGKYKLLRRGLKSQFKDMIKKEEYSPNDLIGIGFDMKLFEYAKNNKIIDFLSIKENIKEAFIKRDKQKIELPLKLFVGTIHSSKGKEADDVILFKDISKRIAKEIIKDTISWENEIRVFHVGQTRPKERLIILRGGFEYADSDIIP